MSLPYTGILGQFNARGGLTVATRVPSTIVTPPGTGGAYRPAMAYGTAITYDKEPPITIGIEPDAPAPQASQFASRPTECR